MAFLRVFNLLLYIQDIRSIIFGVSLLFCEPNGMTQVSSESEWINVRHSTWHGRDLKIPPI